MAGEYTPRISLCQTPKRKKETRTPKGIEIEIQEQVRGAVSADAGKSASEGSPSDDTALYKCMFQEDDRIRAIVAMVHAGGSCSASPSRFTSTTSARIGFAAEQETRHWNGPCGARGE